jgi:hypothetical protein
MVALYTVWYTSVKQHKSQKGLSQAMAAGIMTDLAEFNRRQPAKGRASVGHTNISRHGCGMFPKKKQRKKQTVLAQIREQYKEAKAAKEPPPQPSERYPDPETVDEVISKSRKIARARLRRRKQR